MSKNKFEVIIIGGSYAGLSAALALGRSRRSVLVIDNGLPCNRQTPHSHNFLTHDGEKPAAIAEKARREMANYKSVQILNELANDGKKSDSGFEIHTKSGNIFQSKKLIFATGLLDLMPAIEGFSECWGISVVHCPYCHGYEFRDQKTGILANGEKAFHLSSLVSNLTDDITILSSGNLDFSEAQKNKLKRQKVKINNQELTEIVHDNGEIKEVVFKDGSREIFAAIYAAIPFKQHSEIPAALGCELTENGLIKVDSFQQTTVEGVYACGDNSGMRSVAHAVYSGGLAGAMINKSLTDEKWL